MLLRKQYADENCKCNKPVPTLSEKPKYEELSPQAKLRALLEGKDLGFIMEAHNALSARLATDAGFKALWASSLTLSTSMGLRDANELSWSQVLDLVDPMLEFVDTPILVDADSGYGDFNIFGRFVRKASARGVAGVCIEDKAFPKRNSFANTTHQLADLDEFCGMIRAAKEQQNSPDFCVVARTEALVAGAGLSEALHRASMYEAAGADALFVHSKQKTAFEIEAFCNSWKGEIPLLIAPTTYANTPTAEFERLGISAVIWANHGLRAAVKALQDSYQQIAKDKSTANLETQIAPVSELLDLTGTEDLIAKQSAYQSTLKKSGS